MLAKWTPVIVSTWSDDGHFDSTGGNEATVPVVGGEAADCRRSLSRGSVGKAGTFAALLTFGRRRGTCLHEFLDGRYRQVDPLVTVQELEA